jgi:hypothetical protein
VPFAFSRLLKNQPRAITPEQVQEMFQGAAAANGLGYTLGPVQTWEAGKEVLGAFASDLASRINEFFQKEPK